MFCGRSRMPSVRIVNSATTAIRAMKMPFLPRSARTWLSQSVNLFSVGLTFAPTAVLGLVSTCACLLAPRQRGFSMVMSLRTVSGVASSIGSSPVMRPSESAYTRSEMPRSSGNSDEITMIPFPDAASLLMIV